MDKSKIYAEIDRLSNRFKDISLEIGRNPELGHEEFFASGQLTVLLEDNGFEVRRGILGLPTAFLATYRSSKPGPTIAFLAEYDALPELGHACGHHIIGVMSSAAAIGAKVAAEELGGEIRVYGTPAEETKGAKVPLSAEGWFDDVDAALMAHPYYRHEKSGSSLAMDALQFDFRGRAAHAAAAPHEGINALDGVIQLFNAINALRQQLTPDVRIHGIITNGGKAANIIPDFASAQFYVRSATRPTTDEVVRKVIRCAEGAALQTGCQLHYFNYEYSYDELVTNRTLSDVYTKNLTQLGVSPSDIHEGEDHGSLDLGNVSRRCPSIHPFLQVVDSCLQLHTEAFRDEAMKPRAMEGMLLGARALAGTAADLLADPALVAAIREEFRSAVRNGTNAE
ncbi:M20 family metallopeptidase [Paenibacillus thermoaerophilus]|uniref:Peptidase M20 domain-containing protein 2 n=1 Tax=Paenibacillus thermoaerophilus TaxID=1215385 RepID=A0ABW2V693_9BACL|nr:M20 family metallopeptidase [Paenibacillus thermoaerophilus]TMV17166.1 M20 family metallopeptidase [Paenibacillus thermoaerophilus]